ncbi:MAG: hypothetical protein WC323_02025 [Patescibacteria group bacterium]|jgi:tetratricopeptide (TPR) repeat protein/O-antigen ligase
MAKIFSSSKEKNVLVSGCEAVITVTSSLIFFLIPLFFTGLVSQGIVFEKVVLFYLLVLLGLVAWITKGVAVGELKIIRTPLDLPIIISGGVLLISSIFSVDKISSFIGSYGATTKSFIAFLIYAVFYYVLANNINYKRLEIFFWSLLAGIIITVFYSFLQISGIFILPFAITKAVRFNSIGTSSSLGVYIAAILPLLSIAISFALKGEGYSLVKKTLRYLWVALISLTVLAAVAILFLLNNFIYWPIAILGIVILLMFVLSKVISLRPLETVVPIIIFLALIILLVGGNFNTISAQLPTEVNLSRNLSWNIAKESIKRDPLFGSGPATFDYSFAKYRGTNFNINNLWNVRFDTPSGVFFEALASIGILGTFMFLSIGLIIISIAFIALTKSGNKETKIFLLGLFASLTVLVLNALITGISGTIILLIAITGSLTAALIIIDYPEKFKELKLSFRSSPKYALALSSLFLLVSAGVVVLFTSGFKIYLADLYANKAAASNGEQAVEYLNRAISTADYQDQYYLRLSRLYLSLANEEAVKESGANMDAIRNYLSSAILSGKKAAELAPNSVINKESLALVYENAAGYNIQGALEWAEKYYTDIIQLEPDNPSAYIKLALINMAFANNEESAEEKNHFYDQAIKFYEEAINKKSNLASAYYGISVVYERRNDYNKAIEELGKAVGLAGDNLDYRFELGRMYFNRGMLAQNSGENAAEITTSQNTGAEGEEDLSVNQSSGIKQAVMNDDLKTSEAVFKNILEFSENHANSIYSLALIYESIGDREQAIEYYEKLLKIVGDQPTKDAILAKLRSL